MQFAPGSMTSQIDQQTDFTLQGWLLRDVLLGSFFFFFIAGLVQTTNGAGVLYAGIGSLFGFLIAYVSIYILHEWGHLIGARLTVSNMQLAPYKSALIGHFDPGAHTALQFLALSWGGVIAYLLAGSLMLVLWTILPNNVTAGMAVAALAFTVQSLAVDLPQVFKVHCGENPLITNQAGTKPAVIMKRTWQTWIPLGLILLGGKFFT